MARFDEIMARFDEIMAKLYMFGGDGQRDIKVKISRSNVDQIMCCGWDGAILIETDQM